MKKLTLACALLASCSVFATDVFVRTNSDATSWNNIPNANILTLDASNKLPNVGIDSIFYLAPGTYTAFGLTVGKTGSTQSKIYGGFTGSESVINLNARLTADKDTNGIVEPWEFVNEAIITATHDSTKFTGKGSPSGTRLIIISGTGAEVNGVTITDFNYLSYAGPITLGVAGSTGTAGNNISGKEGILRLCSVKRIKSATGIVMSTNKFSLIENCLIESNVTTAANTGGPVFLNACGGKVSGCVIRNNAVTGTGARGGGLFATGLGSTDMDAIVLNCVIHNNYAVGNGGGLRSETATAGKRGIQILNTTIVNNKTTASGSTSAASVELITSGSIANSIIVGDHSGEIRTNNGNTYIVSNVYGDSIYTTGGVKTGNVQKKSTEDLNYTTPTDFIGAMIPDFTTPYESQKYYAIRRANFSIKNSSSQACLVSGISALPTSYSFTNASAPTSGTINFSASVPTTDITGASRAGNTTIGAYIYQQPTKIETAKASNGASAYAAGNSIVLKGNAGDIASVYNVTGKLIRKVTLTANQTTVAAEKGLYIVVLGAHKNKVIVK